MSMIPLNQYIEILRILPIFCVDVVVRNSRGKYLLLKRTNEPKKGQWWVIGGRVNKGETMEDAAIRKVKEEIGSRVKNLCPIGYFELVNGKNPFGVSFKYHSLSVVFSTVIDDKTAIKLDHQSEKFKFAKKLPDDFNIKTFEAI